MTTAGKNATVKGMRQCFFVILLSILVPAMSQHLDCLRTARGEGGFQQEKATVSAPASIPAPSPIITDEVNETAGEQPLNPQAQFFVAPCVLKGRLPFADEFFPAQPPRTSILPRYIKAIIAQQMLP